MVVPVICTPIYKPTAFVKRHRKQKTNTKQKMAQETDERTNNGAGSPSVPRGGEAYRGGIHGHGNYRRGSGGGGGAAGAAGAGAGVKGGVSAKLTSMAAGYLVSLLKEPEVAQELWPLITKCMDNVVARRSVPSSLEVLRRAVATLPAHEAKSWFGGSRSKEQRLGRGKYIYWNENNL